MPVKIYDLPSGDEEMEGGYGLNDDDDQYGDDQPQMGPVRSSKKKAKAKQGFFGKLFSSSQGDGVEQSQWNDIKHNKLLRKQRIDYLWAKARRYNNKLRLQARLQKMAEQNLREMMIDDIQDDEDDDNQIIDN